MQAIRKAGVKRIYKHGFEAMKLRSLAEDVGIQAGSLYNYIRNKEEFLFLLLKEV
ncbi:TetR/AcrR family transcriptional regulator, partial [Cognatishimia coralii]